ncbi:MAG TPA: flagellar basal body rod modification protein, partial [Candidatus Marinimicrobia bacterium]|nr:flagellar basal body rod modification protein [Candidatus Neomarinimicrobiota bacterium]
TTGELRGNSAGARGAPFRGDGIYKSIDNGYNWELISSTSTNTPEFFDNYLNYSWRIKVHPTTGHVFTASFGTIYKSEDEGTTWNVILGNGEDRYTDLTMTSKGLMIAVLGDEESDG